MALKQLFSSFSRYIIIFHKTIDSVPTAIKYFRKMFLEWHMVATTTIGLLVCIVALWDPRWVRVRDFSCFVGILHEGHISGLTGGLHILNMYAQ